MHVIGCCWVFRIMLDGTKPSSLPRAFISVKVRNLTSRTVSPVVKSTMIRTILALVVAHSRSLHHIDICNAFLNGKLSEMIYMSQSPSFRCTKNPNQIYRLRRASYKLKQAPRTWYRHMLDFFLPCGFHNSFADASLSVRN